MSILEGLSEEECYLYAIFSDRSGLDLAEFSMVDLENDDACFRAWPFQWKWWRDDSGRQIDCAARSLGKALDVETPIPTPEGWVRIGDIEAGDVVYDENGNVVNVVNAFDFLYNRECYEVVFDDGSAIVADAEHQWVTELCKKKNSESIRTTGEIRDTLKKHGESNHRIPVCSPLAGERVDLQVTPYFLGFWLGDGDTAQAALTIGDQDIDEMTLILGDEGYSLNKMSSKCHYKVTQTGVETEWKYLEVFDNDDYRPQGRSLTSKEVRLIRDKAHCGFSLLSLAEEFSTTPASITQFVRGQFRRNAGGYIRADVAGNEINSALREVGVIGNKHIPSQLMRGTIEQRLSLLQGLMDSDGHCTRSGSRCEITLKDKNLASQVKELIMSLGQRAFWSEKRAYCNGVDAGLVYRVGFTPLDIQPFRLSRKMDRVNKTLSANSRKRLSYRRVVDVRKVDSRPVRCISVDGESHLYLAGTSMIPTHNSLSIKLRAYAFPFNYPNQEMVITAPEGVHLDAITDVVETAFMNNKLARYMLAAGRSRVKHRPFHVGFNNGSRIMGRIPQHDGKAIKGTHPVVLEQDEACFPADTLILTKKGYKWIVDIVPGEMVLTHKNRWRKVLENIDNGERDVVEIRGHGHPNLRVTPNHRFWARTPEFKDKVNNWGVKSFGPYEWIQADDLKNKYWTSFNQIAPVEIPALIARAKTGSNNKDYQILNPDFIWLLGLYAAEGSTSSAYGAGKGVTKATWSIHVDEVDYVMKRMRMAGLKAFVQPVQCTENCFNVVVASVELAKFVDKNIGKGCYSKTVPNWVMSLPEELRSSFLDGLVYGDGHNCSDDRYAPGRWKLSTTSKALAFSARTLAQSLGYHVAVHYVPGGRIGSIRGKEFISGPSYQIVGSRSGYVKSDGDYCLSRVKSVKPAGRERVYDLTVEDDHSFVAEGVIVHNSDYPSQGWMEIIETLKMGSENPVWRAHGVTRGVRDYFYKFTQPDSGWKVHRIVAMARPTWSDEERQAKIELYGSRDHPDYRRNVLGDHGDSENVLFVLSRLMATVDQNEDSDYNSKLYTSIKITPEKIAEVGGVLNLLDIPRTHMEYEKFWIGMDVGYINDPSEIVVFGEETVGKKRTLRLLTRFSLERVAHQDQVETILWVLETYKPQCFAADKTGLGLPLYQAILHETQKHPVLKRQTDKIKGFGFSEKILAEIDTSIEVDPHMGDLVKEAGIHRNVLEWSTDILRGMVDKGTVVLPYDLSVIQQFQGQTYHYSKASQDMYGRRRIFSQGTFHVLDACRMAVLGWQQADLAPMLVQEKKQIARPMFMFG